MLQFIALTRSLLPALAALAALSGAATNAHAEALLVVEADSGKVLHAENATYPWYPASVTKLMTTYVTLKAVKDRRITLDSLFKVSPNAAAQQPAKMGFPAGTEVTVDNALKMLMVKSANDIAVVLAEGVSGSIESFAAEMNLTAQRLGMTQTTYVNPNGLPAEGQVTSARDLAILARALLRDLPEFESYLHISGIKYGRRTMRNYNALLGRYPGADGMKTGFICASGFNLVASATRNGKRIIAVVLGSPSSSVRTLKAAQLLERGFSSGGLSWLTPSLGTVENLVPVNAEPPNLRDEMCGPKRKRPAAESDDASEDTTSANGDGGVSLYTSLRGPGTRWSDLIGPVPALVDVAVVYTGPKRIGPALATVTTDAPAKPKPKAQAKPKATAAVTPTAKPENKPQAKPAASPAKPATTAARPATAPKAAPKPATAAKPAAASNATAAPKPAATATAAAKPKADSKAGAAPKPN